MQSISTVQGEVPEVAVYAREPSDAAFVASPTSEQIQAGAEPLDPLPVQWWNYYTQLETKLQNSVRKYMLDLYNELIAVMTVGGVTPSGTSGQFLAGLKAAMMAQNADGTAAIPVRSALNIGAGSVDGHANNATVQGTSALLLATVGTPDIRDVAVTNTKLANGAVTGAANSATTLGTSKIGLATVGTPNLRDSAVATSKLADAAATTAKIADKNVTTAKLADAAATTAKIADENVTTEKLADAAATTAKIADKNVTTAKLADGAVTPAKLAAGAYRLSLSGSTLTLQRYNGSSWVDENSVTLPSTAHAVSATYLRPSGSTSTAVTADSSGNLTAHTVTLS